MKINREILFVGDLSEINQSSPVNNSFNKLQIELESLQFHISHANSINDATVYFQSCPNFSAIGLYFHDKLMTQDQEKKVIEFITDVRQRNKSIPFFILSSNNTIAELSLSILKEVHEYIYLLSETASFTANRISMAIKQYNDQLLPPYFKTLKNFTEDGDYYWDCPGHMGGMAYKKHPVGAEFINFFGENMMRADIGVATSEMGDYLEHIGPSKLSEDRASTLFGSDKTYYSVGGSSASNRIVTQAVIPENEVCIVDRNCHKSLNQGLTLSHARPVYLKPTRNGLGMIGPIPTHRLSEDHIISLIHHSVLIKEPAETVRPVYAVITNCTYDGFCYNVNNVVSELKGVVPRIHFDEAWYAYAKFHPLYKGRFAMGVDEDISDRPTIIAVQSTHKMLPALSMASMIHIKQSDRAPVNYHNFNDAFMMHGTTSPFYPIIASMDVAVSMMEGDSGLSLMQESIEDAISFRKTVVSIQRQLLEKYGDSKSAWFFDVLQPSQVTNPNTHQEYSFEEAPMSLLSSEPSCWALGADNDWHGFSKEDIQTTDCMLDPVKVTIKCPGMTPSGQVKEMGIPGYIVTKFLDCRRTEIARTGDYTLLILFSVGTTKGKWSTLIESLLEFKRMYDNGTLVIDAIPSLKSHAAEYVNMSLKDLCDTMHKKMSDLQLLEQLEAAVNAEPEPVITPAEAYQKTVRGETEFVPLHDFADRVAASMLVPYPPGIPVLMPGERVPADNNAILCYLSALQKFDQSFPGFEHEIHGVVVDDNGQYTVRAIIER
ncbi:Orn/Lys/Arg decarboxylase N-terminal domain-containing protein [Photobacterium kishitanii]|uniref:Arginine decarboxylase n=1 Tax=Photobacterium kishitanii TaxID=318456 RepID=A0A2T3KBQ3_9GAMM|nr:Orn/Lys/Arg decarboxylase N-terminal domain-containing protein [Photobacterium kishitanii]PSU92053.1 arginine decarboxylase [Photobacterium kishitanii]